MNSSSVSSTRTPSGDDAPARDTRAAEGAVASATALNPKRVAELDNIFAADGLLARQIEGYRSRASQIEMARAVAAAMEASGRAMPEPHAAAAGRIRRRDIEPWR